MKEQNQVKGTNIATVEKVFDQLIHFMDANEDQAILEKAYSISEFIYKSHQDLTEIQQQMTDMKE